jgi:hypothetical protein
LQNVRGYAQALEGWEINAISTLESPQYWGPIDEGTDAAGVGPLPVSPPANSPIRWSFYGSPSDFKVGTNRNSVLFWRNQLIVRCQRVGIGRQNRWTVDGLFESFWVLTPREIPS